MCVKINVLYAQCTVYTVHIAYICAMYSVHCTYCIYMRIAQYAFLFTLAGPTDFARINKITTRQT